MTTRFDLHQENLKKIFCPRSVAIVGATKAKGTVPYDIVENILKSDLPIVSTLFKIWVVLKIMIRVMF